MVLLEVHVLSKPGFQHRLAAQSFRFLRQHPKVEHPVVLVVLPHRRLKLGPAKTPRQLQVFPNEVEWLSLEELGQQADLDPQLKLLTLPVRPEAELGPSTQQILERRLDLISAVLPCSLEASHTHPRGADGVRRHPHRPAAPHPRRPDAPGIRRGGVKPAASPAAVQPRPPR